MTGLSRRQLFKAVPAVGAAVFVPTGAMAGEECIAERVDRLSAELSEAMGQWLNGKFVAYVKPHGAVTFCRADSIRLVPSSGPEDGSDDCVAEVMAVERAYSRHEAAFKAQDAGNGYDLEVSLALDEIDEAVLALCRAQPRTIQGQQRRSTLLAKILPGEVEGRLEWSKVIFDALLGERSTFAGASGLGGYE